MALLYIPNVAGTRSEPQDLRMGLLRAIECSYGVGIVPDPLVQVWTDAIGHHCGRDGTWRRRLRAPVECALKHTSPQGVSRGFWVIWDFGSKHDMRVTPC